MDALPQLCVLGLVSGVITGTVMVAFRLLLEAGAALYMPDGDPEAFEGLGIRNFWLIKCQRCKEENLSQRII